MLGDGPGELKDLSGIVTGDRREAGPRPAELRRFARLAAALSRTGGAAAVERALPLFSGIGVAAAILFGGNGMDARDVVAVAGRSLPVRLGLWAAWLAAATPPVRALLAAPAALFFRSLPFARWQHLAIAAAHVLALQAPWALLWGAGGGPARGLAAALVAAGLAALLVARPASALDGLTGVLLLAGALLPLPPAALLAGALPLFAWALRAAWVRAGDRAPSPLCLVAGPPPVALALSYSARLLRPEAALLLRAAFGALAGGALAGAAALNNDALAPAALAEYALAVTAVFLTIGLGGLAGPVRAAEREIAWLLDSTAQGPWVRAAASRGALAAWGALLGLLAGAATAACAGAGGAAAARAILVTALSGAALGALALEVVLRSERRGALDGGRLVAALVALVLGSLGAVAALGERAPGAALLLASALCARAAYTPRRRPRPADIESSKGASMILELSSVQKRLGGRRVLDGVSLSWPGPGVLVIRGENGAGKSTLLRIVAGVLEKDEGAVAIAGCSLDRARARALSSVGYVPDVGELPAHLVTRELFALLAALKRAAPPDAALLDRLGVRPLLGERLGALSLGQRRRVGLLSALLGEPKLLVLDEPTNGLDAEGLGELTALLRERSAQGLSALVATHDVGFADAVGATRLLLQGGKLVDQGGAPAGPDVMPGSRARALS